MADNHFATLVSKDSNVNAVANAIFTQLSDGTNAIGVTSNSLDVNLTNTSVAVTGTFFQTTQPVSIAATVNVDIQDSWAGLTGGGTEAGALRVTIANDSTGVLTVDASDLDIRNLNLTDDAVKISANTSANSAGNPIYVALGSGPIAGEVHDYDTATVAGNTPDNHDYQVVTAMLVKSIIVASSGALKAELQVGPVASLVSKAVLFIPKAGGSQQVDFDPPIEVPVTSTGTVRIIRTNREASSNDVYSTIIGIDA